MISSIDIVTSELSPGYIRIAVSGVAGIGSAGNQHGDQIRDVIQDAVACGSPHGILVDLREFQYRYGNYLCTAVATKVSCRNGICVLASGSSFVALRELWNLSGWHKVAPLFDDESQAVQHLTY